MHSPQRPCYTGPFYFIGLPSRYSASEDDSSARQSLLSHVKKNGFTSNYNEPRIEIFNQPLTIYDGIVWQL